MNREIMHHARSSRDDVERISRWFHMVPHGLIKLRLYLADPDARRTYIDLWRLK